MQPFLIKQAEFETSVGAQGGYPEKSLCEIAIVGRSNVGKSSLINRLTDRGKLARTSASPGKTRLINFFRINRLFHMVDLPGYGFARASKSEKASWGELMETYLGSGRVDHIFMLIDIRHAPTEEDRMMLGYILYYGIPFTLIATKSDKLSRSRRRQEANQNAKLLGAPPYAIPFSAETGEGKEEIFARIGQILSDKMPQEPDKETEA